MDLGILKEMKDYIELREVESVGEFGGGESLEELLEDRNMPELYYKICNLLDTTIA